ncbi:gluconokinase [Nocardia veterana]|uniref:Gluconokinase n=1 Tax=Nocardia veterana TaxID=132249 RepID=A0A7X6RJI7_9NOCA|nr:gluconokinase [Nocardia veterana]NKY88236.1 gluconokinase [Nocardia veterana]
MRPPCVVVMGVSGTGKTTVGHLLADRLGVAFADADDFHSPANIAKMSAGIPLTDADRAPWLAAVGRWLHDRTSDNSGGVMACSALRRRYRDTLRTAAPDIFFLHLAASRDQLIERMTHRRGHYMPVSLVDSQLQALEPLAPDESGAVLNTDRTPDELAAQAATLLHDRG